MSVYLIEINGNMDDFINSINTNCVSCFKEVIKLHVGEEVTLYEPSDHMWWLTTQNPNHYLWHLLKIDAENAWGITKGDPSIPITIVEVEGSGENVNNFDYLHQDLTDNIVHYNHPIQTILPHGTFVAGCASAATSQFGFSQIKPTIRFGISIISPAAA